MTGHDWVLRSGAQIWKARRILSFEVAAASHVFCLKNVCCNLQREIEGAQWGLRALQARLRHGAAFDAAAAGGVWLRGVGCLKLRACGGHVPYRSPQTFERSLLEWLGGSAQSFLSHFWQQSRWSLLSQR